MGESEGEGEGEGEDESVDVLPTPNSERAQTADGSAGIEVVNRNRESTVYMSMLHGLCADFIYALALAAGCCEPLSLCQR